MVLLFKRLKKAIAKATWPTRRRFLRIGLRNRVLNDIHQLDPQTVRASAIQAAQRLLICCIGPETSGLVPFMAHYRGLGVNHFLLVDGSGSEETANWLAAQEDCSVWKPKISFSESNFGTRFYNTLIHHHCLGKWTFCVDLDELFVFPHMETRSLQDLIGQLEDSERRSMWALTIELYSRGPLTEADRSSPDLCYFDPSGYYQLKGTLSQIVVSGGLRARLTAVEGAERSVAPLPILQKIPLLKPDSGTFYANRQHHLLDRKMNAPHKWHPCPTGALLTYKYHRQWWESFATGSHGSSLGSLGIIYSGLLRERLAADPSFTFFKQWSVRFDATRTLIEHGLMSDGAALRPAGQFHEFLRIPPTPPKPVLEP